VSRLRRLDGQTVLVISGSSGIGLETARLARAEGADIILTAGDAELLQRIGLELSASIAAFDATDSDRLGRFFSELPGQIDHLLLSIRGPCYAPGGEMDFDQARRAMDAHLGVPLQVGQLATSTVRADGALLFLSATGWRGPRPDGGPLISALTAALSALTKSLALELAPIRVNLIRAMFIETALSTTLLGDQLDGRARRDPLRTTLPIRRVLAPADVAALALHLMVNTAVTGATLDIDGGRQLVE